MFFKILLYAIIVLVCLSLSIAANKNLDQIVDNIYDGIGSYTMNQIFTNKDGFKNAIIAIDDLYRINLDNADSITSINDAMQTKLLRNAKQERSDIRSNAYFLHNFRP